jgi:uncharacterized protein involved in cysteine biosynthesis
MGGDFYIQVKIYRLKWINILLTALKLTPAAVTGAMHHWITDIEKL